MRVFRNERGFEVITHPQYLEEEESRLVAESSAINFDDDDPDARLLNPGTSYLWIGDKHHLDRKQVKELIWHMTCWLETGDFETSHKMMSGEL